MKNLKSTSRLIISFAFILLLIYTDYLNLFFQYLPLLWSLLIIWSIVCSVRYRNGKIKNEIRFSSNNDEYHKIYPFIIGSILTIAGICAIMYLDEYVIFSSLIVLNGILLIISGFFFIPQGMLYFKKDKMKLQYADQQIVIPSENLINVFLQTDKIIITDQFQKKHTINHLNLKETELHDISNFINQNLGSQIEIETSFKKSA